MSERLNEPTPNAPQSCSPLTWWWTDSGWQEGGDRLVVWRTDYDALAAELAETQRALRTANAVRPDVALVREALSELDAENEALDAITRIAGFVDRAALASGSATEGDA